eukprot:COSAG02_NODE_4785_length_4978_cov_33.844002_4_plen_74_part_00
MAYVNAPCQRSRFILMQRYVTLFLKQSHVAATWRSLRALMISAPLQNFLIRVPSTFCRLSGSTFISLLIASVK